MPSATAFAWSTPPTRDLAPGERCEVIVDFAHHRVGDRVRLVNDFGHGGTGQVMEFRVA